MHVLTRHRALAVCLTGQTSINTPTVTWLTVTVQLIYTNCYHSRRARLLHMFNVMMTLLLIIAMCLVGVLLLGLIELFTETWAY